MNGQKKKEQILNAMQELMNETSADSISVSDMPERPVLGREVYIITFLLKMILLRR